MSTCGGCRGVGCYDGTMNAEEKVSDDNFKYYGNLFEKIFSS